MIEFFPETFMPNISLRPLKNIQFYPRSRKTKILTTGIPLVFRGLKFESDAEMRERGRFSRYLLRTPPGEYRHPPQWVYRDVELSEGPVSDHPGLPP
jgi:hypothetical protein